MKRYDHERFVTEKQLTDYLNEHPNIKVVSIYYESEQNYIVLVYSEEK